MIPKDTIIKVTNRDNGVIAYTIPDLDITRRFQKGESKDLTMEELRKLSYVPGGQAIIDNYLIIHNKEAVDELVHNIQPEYFYSEKEVEILLTTGTLDQLEDCLNFAPAGVIELIKEFAVKLKLNDVNKRNLIFKKTGYNVSKAIEVNEASEEQNDNEESAKQNNRKATPVIINNDEDYARKTELLFPKYDVVE